MVFLKVNIKDYSKGEIIKFIRQWTGLTQEEFAKAMGKSKRTIEQYEAGTINYKIDFFYKLIKVFNIDIIFEKRQ